MPPAPAVLNFEKLFEHAPNAYILVRTDAPDWTVAAVTNAYLEVTHLTRDTLIGHRLFEVFPETEETQQAGGASSIRASLEQAAATGVANRLPVLRYDIRDPDGVYKVRYWQLSNFPIPADQGEIAFVLHKVEELHPDAADAEMLRRELEQTNEELKAANKAKSAFLAMMSHEIRTPINAILGYEELLELELSGPLTPDQRAHLTRIRSSAQHLLGLVNEVLDLTKIESGVLHVAPTHASAGKTVDAALLLIRPQAEARGIKVSSHCTGARDAIYLGDEARARQVLTNLLSNAVKFTEPGGAVSITCVRHDPTTELRLEGGRSYVGFQVTDTGLGIAADQLERIFEPFTQIMQDGQTPYTRESNGTGLGLSISRQLAHLMGGEITVTSFPGHGSTFTFWVPTPPRSDSSP